MLEVLQFILSSPTNFLGTLALMMVAGASVCAALSPFGRPRNMNFYERNSRGEDDDE